MGMRAGVRRLPLGFPPGASGASAPAAFVGPYDGITFVGAYATRRLLTAYEGDCLLLRRSSDSAELAFGFDDEGNLNTAAIATWLGEDTAYVKTWYDQSGNARHVSQATPENQPALNVSLIGSKPTIVYNATDTLDAIVGTMFTGAQATVFETSIWPAGIWPLLLSKEYTVGGGRWVLAIGASSSQRRGVTTGDGAGEKTSTTSAVNAYPADTPFVGTYIIDGATSYYFNGGVGKGTGTQTVQMAESVNAVNWRVGTAGLVTCEVLVADGVLADAACNQIGVSMEANYGIAWTNFT